MKTPPIPKDVLNSERFTQATACIDAENEQDPRQITIDGNELPYELGYALTLTQWVFRRFPEADEFLLLAARAQHLRRWTVPRDSFPAGLAGYLEWRESLMVFHAEEAGRLLAEAGYEDAEIQIVKALIRKDNFPRDPLSCVLEDALCLTFLDLQLTQFSAGKPNEKVIDIIRKTWGKMTEEGQALVAEVSLSSEMQSLVQKAVVEQA